METSPRERRYDAIVVGAGPAGSHAARLLADQGYGVALVDRNHGPRCEIVCSGIIGSEAHQKLELSEEDVVQELRRASFFSPSGHEVRHETEKPFAYVVERTCFDGLLLDRALRAGADYIPGASARDLEVDRDGIVIHLEGDNASVKVVGEIVLVATGHQHWFRHRTNVGIPRRYVHGIHVDVPFRPIEAAELYFGNEIAPGFFAWVVPSGPGRARLGILAHRRGDALFRRFLQSPPVRNRIGPRVFEENGVRFSSRGLIQGLVRPSYAERLLLIGEAAGHVKTTTGGGIHYGILGAEIAAEVALEGFRGRGFAAERLKRYDERCAARFGGEVRSGLALQRIARSMKDEQIDLLFEALRNGLGKTVRKAVRFDWHRQALQALFMGWAGRQRILSGGS
jgi:digeranylgeranylglycerophospholipid reductase